MVTKELPAFGDLPLFPPVTRFGFLQTGLFGLLKPLLTTLLLLYPVDPPSPLDNLLVMVTPHTSDVVLGHIREDVIGVRSLGGDIANMDEGVLWRVVGELLE